MRIIDGGKKNLLAILSFSLVEKTICKIKYSFQQVSGDSASFYRNVFSICFRFSFTNLEFCIEDEQFYDIMIDSDV